MLNVNFKKEQLERSEYKNSKQKSLKTFKIMKFKALSPKNILKNFCFWKIKKKYFRTLSICKNIYVNQLNKLKIKIIKIKLIRKNKNCSEKNKISVL